MNETSVRFLSFIFAVVMLCSLSGCFAAQQMHDKEREEALLKPGALDPQISEQYRAYSYTFLNKYQVSHDWLEGAKPCQYAGYYSSSTSRLPDQIGDIYEIGGITVQDRDSPAYARTKDISHLSIDKYVRSVKVTDKTGKVWETGLKPICDQAWIATSHFLTVYLYKRTVEEWRQFMERNPEGKITMQRAGKNNWLVQQYSQLQSPPLNGAGGPFQTWVLAIGDSGYTLTLRLGASQKSLEHPERHAQIQRIFKHLIDSVRVESLVSR
jgi:hypothetical protein